MPLLAFIVFGILDVGFGMQARETVSLSLGDATRTGAIARTADDADALILGAIANRVDAAIGVQINRVVIYEADGILSEPPASCMQGTPVAGCNVYDSTTVVDPNACSGGWCPDRREADDLLGIWIDAEYTTITNYSPFDLQWSDHAVVIVEPEIVE